MPMRRGFHRDKKTGRIVRSKRLSSAGQRAARRRKGRHLSAATKRKMKMGLMRTRRTGRTKFGRRSLLKRGHR